MAEQVTINSLTALVERPLVETQPPILFLHGYFADASVFQLFLPYFAAQGHHCTALNFRGRGGSRPGTNIGRVSLRDYADDALEAARSSKKPIVVGHSMGGLVAQMVAAEDAVSAAVLLAPAPPRGISVMTLDLAFTQLRYLPAILTSRVVTPRREDLRRVAMNCLPRAEQELALDSLVPDSGRAGRDMSITGVPVDASRVGVPVYVVGGDQDVFIPPSCAARIADRYGAPLRIARGRGHMLVIEPGWEEDARAIEHWLEQQPSLRHSPG